MFKGCTIFLRLLEPEDCEITYKWRNDYDLMKMTSGPIRYISKEMERDWAQRRSSENLTDIYLAICSYESEVMIGWISLNNIDYVNRKCCLGGVVIGDKEHQNGVEYVESIKMVMEYAFDQLNMNRIYSSCLEEHILSRAEPLAFFSNVEGIERQSVYKDGEYHNVYNFGLLREDYLIHKAEGDYELTKIIKRMVKIAKIIKKNNKYGIADFC